VHPRTRQRLRAGGKGAFPGVVLLEPLGYLDFIALLRSAALVVTDSGGIQEEANVLGVPCLTVRRSTERPVTLEGGANRLIALDRDQISDAARLSLAQPPQTWPKPELWDGCAALRIADTFEAMRPASL
jgi:UDP-N-acetylglucosamine 2-epimerase (non-hydrolysing)